MESTAPNFRCYPLPDDQRENDSGRECEILNDVRKNDTGSIRKPVTIKNKRNEKRISKELQLALRRLVMTALLTARPAKECANYTGQIDDLCEQARRRHDGEHENEIGVLVVF